MTTVTDTPPVDVAAPTEEDEPFRLALALGDARGLTRAWRCLTLATRHKDARLHVTQRIGQDFEAIGYFCKAFHARWRATSVACAWALALTCVALTWINPALGAAAPVVLYTATVPLRWRVKAVFKRQCRYSEKVRKTELEHGTIHTADYRDHKKVVGDRNPAAAQRQQAERHRTILVPKLRDVTRTRSGWKATLKMQRGMTVDYFQKWSHTVAAGWVHRINVKVDHDDPGKGTVSIILRDQLRGPAIPHPGLQVPTDFWEKCKLGDDENGDEVARVLPYENILIGGVPESGKSTLAKNVLIHAAGDARVPGWLVDPSGVDFLPFEQCVTKHGQGAYVRGTPATAIAVMRLVEKEIERREEWLAKVYRDTGEYRDKIEPGDPVPPGLFMMDEWGRLRMECHRDQRKTFDALLYKILTNSRKVAICVLLITQDPRYDVIEVRHRNMCTFRAAHRVIGDTASDVILGDNTAEELGRSAYREIGKDQKGVSLTFDESEGFVKFRSYSPTRHQIVEYAGKCAEMRGAYREAMDAVAQGGMGPLWSAEYEGMGSESQEESGSGDGESGESGGVNGSREGVEGGSGNGSEESRGGVGWVSEDQEDGTSKLKFNGGNGSGPKPGQRPSDRR